MARRWRRAGIVLAAAAAFVFLALGAFPWGLLRGVVEERLARQLGRPVKIAAIERIDRFSFHPMIAIRGVRIAQPAWVGAGDLARIDEAKISFPAWRLAIGQFRPSAIDVRGMRLDLVRSADGRENWRGKAGGAESGGRPLLRHLTMADSHISYHDAKRDRSFAARIDADSTGMKLSGDGLIRAAPVRILAHGAPVSGSGPWPFDATIDGAAVGMTLAGTMDGPLDTGHFSARATGHARDLKLLDAIIEAGLPATQPVKLVAKVRHDGTDWRVDDLKGMIGRSDIAGHATIRKRDGRHLIDGAVRAARFDFDDLSSDEGKGKAAAKRARFGRRIVPDTAIDLDNVRHTDGMLAIDVDRLLWPGPSPFRGLHGRLQVDHGLLTIDPLSLLLTHGTMEGRLQIDQRKSGPMLDVRLTAHDARLMDFVPDAGIDGDLRGHIRLSGPGRTIRAAIGRSNGSVALVARDGVIPARTASLLGLDVGRGLFGSKDRLASLHCMIVRLDVADGIARPAPVLIDTSRAVTRIGGSIALADERMALSLQGMSKKPGGLRLDAAIPIGGTIKAPDISVPEQARSVGGIIKAIGRALSDNDRPVAADLDCNGLATKALR